MGEPFTVLLPCYVNDSAEALEMSFRSVTDAQTRRPDQVVVVVDGPVPALLDARIDRLAATSSVPTRVLRLPHNVGLGSALTQGLAVCAHDVIARQDADDVSLPERFERQLPLVEDGHDLVGSSLVEFDSVVTDLGRRRVPPLRPGAIARGARFAQPVFHPTAVYRRSFVERVGGYEDLPFLEDYWLFARMIHAGARVANVAEPLVRYRVGDGAYSRRGGLAILRSEIELQRRFHAIGFTSTPQFVRNLVVRATYRLTPVSVRRAAYRRFLAQRWIR